ncbi:MAG: LEA type 2 family protein [Halobacteriales archaeon]|nr:LEA type 2 family protein [Halobacteriales archaeon]
MDVDLPFDGNALVRRIENEWGEITDDETEIRTRVVLDGRNLVEARVTSVGMRYDAYMNGVRVARSEKKGVSLNRRSTTIHLSAYIERSRLLEWWRTHVNNGERTRLVIKPHVTLDLPKLDLSAFDFAGIGIDTYPFVGQPFGSISIETPNYVTEFETGILDSIRTDERMSAKAFGRTVFAVDWVDARWGDTDDKKTHVELRAEVVNPNPFAVGFEDIGYTVGMNGVRVGEGGVGDFRVPARSTKTVSSDAVLTNERIADWWTTHLRRGEKTETEIIFGGAVRVLGFGRKIGDRSYTGSFETDLFGSSGFLDD